MDIDSFNLKTAEFGYNVTEGTKWIVSLWGAWKSEEKDIARQNTGLHDFT
jgi:hypothetical protein